jgi:hypothetical protein
MATAATSAMPAIPAAGSIPPYPSTTTTSPQRRPRRKQNNSFLLFEHAAIPHNASAEDLSKSSIVEGSESPASEDNDDDPLYRRLIMMPLLSVSFILSLFLVERSERARRASEHPSQNQSFWATFSLQHWLDPEPYQDPDDATWQDSSDGNANAPKGQVPHSKKRQWYVRKKAAKVGKMSITDAFDMSGTVMVMLLAFVCVVLFGLSYGGVKAYHGLMTRFRA